MTKTDKNKHKAYEFVWSTDSAGDGYQVDSIEEGLRMVEETYIEWQIQLFEDTPIGTKLSKFIEDWNYLIDSCCCWVTPFQGYYEGNTPIYYDDSMDSYIYLSDEQCRAIDWNYWEELSDNAHKLYIEHLKLSNDLEETTSTNVANKLDDGIIAE